MAPPIPCNNYSLSLFPLSHSPTNKPPKKPEINPSNLAPAWEAIPSAPPGPNQLQLTETVITNLTATLNLPVASLFQFDTKPIAAANAKCKVFPGDADYPSKAEWAIFSILAGNALIETVPLGAYCFANSGVYDAARCQYLLDNWTKSEIQYVAILFPRHLTLSPIS